MVVLDTMHLRVQPLPLGEPDLRILMGTLNDLGLQAFQRMPIQEGAQTGEAIEFILRDGTKAYVVKSTIQADGGHCIVVYSEREETCRRLAGALTQPFCEFIAGLAPNAAKSRQALEGVGYEDQRTRIQGYTRAQWEAWEQRRGHHAGQRAAQAAAPAPAQAAERRAQAAASTPAQAAERRAEAANDAVAQAQATLRAAQAEAQAASDAAAQAAQAQAADDAAAQAPPAQARRDRDRDRDRKKRKHDEELTAEEIAERMRYYAELAEKRRRGTE